MNDYLQTSGEAECDDEASAELMAFENNKIKLIRSHLKEIADQLQEIQNVLH